MKTFAPALYALMPSIMKTNLQAAISKLRQDPIGFLRRVLYKTWVAPVAVQGRHSLFYVKFRTVEGIKKRLSACLSGELTPFRDDSLLIAGKPPKQLANAG